MITLDKEQIKRLHKKMMDATGGLNDFTDDDLIYIGLELASGKMDDKQLLDLILERSKY